MVNESIRIGLANDVSSLRRLSLLSYNQLAPYDSPRCYKLCAISEQQEYYQQGRSLLREGFLLGPRMLSDSSSCIMLRLQDEERWTRDSSIKRDTFEHTLTKHTLDVISQPGVGVGP